MIIKGWIVIPNTKLIYLPIIVINVKDVEGVVKELDEYDYIVIIDDNKGLIYVPELEIVFKVAEEGGSNEGNVVQSM